MRVHARIKSRDRSIFHDFFVRRAILLKNLIKLASTDKFKISQSQTPKNTMLKFIVVESLHSRFSVRRICNCKLFRRATSWNLLLTNLSSVLHERKKSVVQFRRSIQLSPSFGERECDKQWITTAAAIVANQPCHETLDLPRNLFFVLINRYERNRNSIKQISGRYFVRINSPVTRVKSMNSRYHGMLMRCKSEFTRENLFITVQQVL